MAARVTDRLWEVSDLVALLEADERRLERAALDSIMIINVIVLIAGIGIGIFSAVFPDRAAEQWRPKYQDLPLYAVTAHRRIRRIGGIIFAIVCAAFLLKVATSSK